MGTPGTAGPPRRCCGCGALMLPKVTGDWVARKHAPGCPEDGVAARVIRYSNDLKRAVSSGRKWTRDPDERAWRKHIDEAAAELTHAGWSPCASAALKNLWSRYEAANPPQDAKGTAGIAAAAAMLSRACEALALGKDPGPVIVFKARGEPSQGSGGSTS